jgi:hypothetical protein
MTTKIGAGSGADALTCGADALACGADALVCEPTPWSDLQKRTRVSAAVPGDCPT